MKVYLPLGGVVKSFDEIDFFARKPAADAILAIAGAAVRPVVFMVDGDWGTGKTYFLRQLDDMLKKSGVGTAFVDAFAIDFHSDAFLALSSEILSSLPSQEAESTRSLVNATAQVARIVLKAGLKGIVKAATVGVVGPQEIDDVRDAIIESVGDSTRDLVDGFIIDSAETRSKVSSFKDLLSKSATSPDSGFTIILIDELDRCRPDFALDLLERIKHFFDVPGLFFVIAANRNQFTHTIRKRYGSDFDAVRYLDKFFDFQIQLSASGQGNQQDQARQYVEFIIPQDFLSQPLRTNFVNYFCSLVSRKRVSLRDIERIFSSASVMIAAARISDAFHPCVLLGLAWLRHFHSEEFRSLPHGGRLSRQAEAELSFSDVAMSRVSQEMLDLTWQVINIGRSQEVRDLEGSKLEAYFFLEGMFGTPVNSRVQEFCALLGAVRSR